MFQVELCACAANGSSPEYPTECSLHCGAYKVNRPPQALYLLCTHRHTRVTTCTFTFVPQWIPPAKPTSHAETKMLATSPRPISKVSVGARVRARRQDATQNVCARVCTTECSRDCLPPTHWPTLTHGVRIEATHTHALLLTRRIATRASRKTVHTHTHTHTRTHYCPPPPQGEGEYLFAAFSVFTCMKFEVQ